MAVKKAQLLITTGVVTCFTLPIVAAFAQESGLEITATVGETLRVSDNFERVLDPSGTSVVAQTDLNFNLKSETSVDSLVIGLGGVIEAGHFADRRDDNVDLDQSFFNANYTRSVSDTRFSFGGSFRNSDVTDTDITEGFDDRDLIVDVGELSTYGVTFGFETGIDAPFGLSFDSSLQKREYSNTSNEDLFDSDSQSYDLVARFDLTPTTTLRALTGYSEFDSQDNEDTLRESTYVGLGLTHEFSPSVSANFQLTYDRNETHETIDDRRRETTHEGPAVESGFRVDRPNGSIGARYNSRISSTGRTDTLWFDRDLDLPRGALSFSLGATESDNSSVRGIANITFSQELPSGLFNATFAQSATTRNEDEDEAIRTTLNLGYTHQINSISSLAASANLANINVLGDTGGDSDRATLSLTYRHEVTKDWDLTAGVEHYFSKQEDQRNRTSNTVFMGLERSFSFRP